MSVVLVRMAELQGRQGISEGHGYQRVEIMDIRWILAFFAIATILDGATTFAGVYSGQGEEMNPLAKLFLHPEMPLSASLYIWIAFSFVFSAGAILVIKAISDFIHKYKTRKGIERLGRVGVLIVRHYNLKNWLMIGTIPHLVGFWSGIAAGVI